MLSGVSMDCAGCTMHKGPLAFRSLSHLVKHFSTYYPIKNSVSTSEQRSTYTAMQIIWNPVLFVKSLWCVTCQFVTAVCMWAYSCLGEKALLGWLQKMLYNFKSLGTHHERSAHGYLNSNYATGYAHCTKDCCVCGLITNRHHHHN